MKKIPITLLLISFQLCYSQSLEQIKNADTIYVYYNGKQGENKTIGDLNASYGPRTTFDFKISDNFDLTLTTSKYLNFDDYQINKLADVRIVDCKFLKTYKNVIITNKFLMKNVKYMSPDKIYKWVQENIKNKRKAFYLIDKQEKKNGKIILRETNPFFESYEPSWNDIEPFEIKIINTDSIKN